MPFTEITLARGGGRPADVIVPRRKGDAAFTLPKLFVARGSSR